MFDLHKIEDTIKNVSKILQKFEKINEENCKKMQSYLEVHNRKMMIICSICLTCIMISLIIFLKKYDYHTQIKASFLLLGMFVLLLVLLTMLILFLTFLIFFHNITNVIVDCEMMSE